MEPLHYELNIEDDITLGEYVDAVVSSLPMAEEVLKRRLCILMRDGEVCEVVEFQGDAKVRTLHGGGIDYIVDELGPVEDVDHDRKEDRTK